MAYPTTIDSIPDPTPTNRRNAPSLANGQVAQNDSIEAIQTYVGVTGSAVPGTVTKTANDAATAAATNAANIVLTSGLLFGTGVPAGGTGVNGNLYLNDATGIIYRKTAGSWAAIYTPAGGGVSIGSAPQLNGFSWWSQDIEVAGGFGSAPTVVSGTLQLARIYFPRALTVTNLHLFCVTAGTVTGSYGGLYTAAGALLSQSTNQGACSANVTKQFPLAVAQAVTANTAYYAAFFFVHSASPTFTCLAGNSVFYNTNTAAPNLRYASADAGLTTTMPANFGAQSAGTKSYWVAVS